MRHCLIALAALAAAGPAFADDSSAALSAGGVVFTANTPVKMAAEDLYVSPKAVRIRFEFVNPAKKDVDTIVAFPLPDIDTAEFYGSAVGTVTDDPANFVGFKAVVDGKPVAFTVEQRAFVKKKDVTQIVLAAGAPLNPIAGEGYSKLAALPRDKQKALVAAGVAEGEGGDDFVPQWTVRTRFYWPQKFPAGKTVVIEHSYQPVTGQFFFSTQYQKRTDKYGDIDYCFDPGTWASLDARTAQKKQPDSDAGTYMNAYETDYILKTANNWQGPIGRFHLSLDKLRPDNVLSLCWDGDLKKTGPTTFEFSAQNFAPRQDIHIIVLETAAPME
ncbi:MAG TPA: DUF4424 family protein [Rhizomicrobium sp.]|nr:DUF4424 family protein [Rhizomicrobium sp.]